MRLAAHHAIGARVRLLKLLKRLLVRVEAVVVHAVEDRCAHAFGGHPLGIHVKVGGRAAYPVAVHGRADPRHVRRLGEVVAIHARVPAREKGRGGVRRANRLGR